MLEVKMEMNFEDLKNNCWSGALDRIKEIEEKGLEDVLMSYLEDIFYDSTPTMTEINDWLWFDADDWILRNTEVEDKEQVKKELDMAGKVYDEDEFNELDMDDYSTIGEVMDELNIE
jgi:hypothetical protein